MKNTIWRGVALSMAFSVGLIGTAVGQTKETPNTPNWNLLEVPQFKEVGGEGHLKRLGDGSEAESLPKLKRIDDSEALATNDAAKKTAAKIKAIRYLGTIACSCPANKDKIKAALVGSLSDRSASVRQAAAEAIGHAAENPCPVCNECSCCSAEVTKRLVELAEGKASSGEWIEPSKAVRAAAAEALTACKQNTLPALVPAKINTKPDKHAAAHLAELVGQLGASSEPAGYAEAVADSSQEPLLISGRESVLGTSKTTVKQPAKSQEIRMLPISFEPEIQHLRP